MTQPLQPGVIEYYGDYADYAGFGGLHSNVDPASGACTVQGGFTSVGGKQTTPGTEMKIGWVADPTACPIGSAIHAAPAAVRIGTTWYSGTVRIYNDATAEHPGTIGLITSQPGAVTACTFTMTYPTIQD